MAKSVIDTPCIGVCSTIYGDTICRGCKRHYQEIIHWNTYDGAIKQQVHARLSQMMSNTVRQFLIITNQQLLQQQLHLHGVRYHPTDDPFCWAHHLLRVGTAKIKKLERYGVEVKAEFAHLTVAALFTLIDEKLYAATLRHF